MPFGEYELSPSLIGLSLLHSPHPEAFQRLLVRTSIPCYRDFILDKCRSLGFASTADDSPPSSDSLSLRLGASLPLTWPTTVTRRFIMQKARRHSTNELRPLVGIRFQELFHSQYWFTIGLLRVFSLTGWSRPIHTGFLVSRATQDTATVRFASNTRLSLPSVSLSRDFFSRNFVRCRGPTTPALP